MILLTHKLTREMRDLMETNLVEVLYNNGKTERLFPER